MPLRSPRAFETSCPRTMPVSSTVWCWSTSRSPAAFRVRSKPPCLVKSSSMWSKKRMPVAMAYFPRPSRRREAEICVSFVLRVISADLIDITQNADRAFRLQKRHYLGAARGLRTGDADERHVRRTGAAGVVDGVAHIEQFLARKPIRDLQKAFGVGLPVLHVVRGDDRREAFLAPLTLQGYRRFELAAAGEDREVESAGPGLEETVLGEPPLAMDEALVQEQIVEVVDHRSVPNLHPKVGADLLRQRPVVVPSAGVLVLLYPLACDALAGEMFDGSHDRLAIGFRDVHEDAVHIKDEDLPGYHISPSSFRKRRTWSRVPTVTRTQPGLDRKST